ncbi:phosphoribosylglycinamide synthetase phosphoribosylamine-glycine ligase [Candidatus Accumulibacter aalborgensis]|uniref:Phosphoribosylamine--glycine ligase n=1 Tax=Candidatus Accumulibacter aalborgensis TaxID=1860102 RepID=A0A1A8XTB5_9PROT|nr:phosphoribosylamine--glycine ligase [Candidatus Accumulibacter aalborgensis]SBT07976.1 phosphoribosylglycinamide synthetase phosphoribosylamine-glycine ligase [Candidatus Accumulibacter aalborgensis]
MKLLVIGSGGREHAFAWRLAKTPGLQRIFVAPGNAGTARERELENIGITDPEALADFAEKQKIHLTIVGPEAPLAAGIVNIFRARGLKIFGPTREAAQLESSKAFAKRFMARHHIPTARFATFAERSAAHAYIDQQGAPIVIKADGLAAGKGVMVAMTLAEAHAAIDHMLSDSSVRAPGESATARVVIEEFLEGEEASFIVMVDGKNVLPLASSQDHKRIGDGDTGPNTGGMGAYSPAPVVTPEVHARTMREIILPTVRGMAADGLPYTGFLYAGLMVGKDGSVKTVEFNCRLGDPETQPIMMRLKSDLLTLLEHGVAGRLDQVEASWDRRVALGVVLAAANYPATPRTGDLISGLPKASDDSHVFHAGTMEKNGQIVTSGGRVLCVTTLGDNVKQAQKRAYDLIVGLHFDGMQYRRDIGHRALSR